MQREVSGPAAHRDVTRFHRVFIAAGLLGLIAGCSIFFLRLTPVGVPVDQAGMQAGIVLGVALLWVFLIGGLLVLLHVRAGWSIGAATGGAGYLVLALVFTQIGVQNAQDHASLLELKGILAKVLQQQPIQVQRYPQAQYGRLSALLTVFSQDASVLQQADAAAVARVKQIGFPELASAKTLADPRLRAKAHAQLLELRKVDDAQRLAVHAFITKAHADIDATTLSDLDRRETLEAFDSATSLQVPAVDAYFDTSRNFLDAADQVVNIADRDRPKVEAGKAVFRSDADVAEVKAALARVAALQAQATQQREAIFAKAQGEVDAVD